MEKVLLGVVGMSPAVITETVWALWKEHAIIPDRVVILTTTQGKEVMLRMLFDKNDHAWNRLKETMKTAGANVDGKLLFGDSSDSIRVFPSISKETDLKDISSSEENAAAADFIMQNVREFSENSETEILASIAGGRKTMSALLMSCMSLLGRTQDKVLHVLVNSPFDERLSPPFLFPEGNQPHTAVNGETYQSSEAKITLIDVPFVRMRGWYNEKFKTTPPSYKRLVEAVQGGAPEPIVYPMLYFDYRLGSLKVENLGTVKLSHSEFAALALFVQGERDVPEKLKEFCKSSPKSSERPSWLVNLHESNRFKNEERQSFSKAFSSTRDKLRKLSDTFPVEALLPKRGSEFTYPKNKIKFTGKNPFLDVL